MGYDDGHQINAGTVINNVIPKLRLPCRDSYAFIGITLEDLYPRDSWNFVFGLADMMGRNGVFSFARYINLDETSASTQKLRDARLLKRAVKVMSHELGHCFGFKHCTYFNCLMQGSNSGEEGEKKLHELCPVCLKKLFFAIEFCPVERFMRLK